MNINYDYLIRFSTEALHDLKKACCERIFEHNGQSWKYSDLEEWGQEMNRLYAVYELIDFILKERSLSIA